MNPYSNDHGYNPNGGPTVPRVPPRPNDSAPYIPRAQYGSAPAPDTQPQYTNQTSYGQPAPRQHYQPSSQVPQYQQQPPKRLKAIKTSHEGHAFTNRVVGHPQDFEQYFSHAELKDPSVSKYILVSTREGQYVFCLE